MVVVVVGAGGACVGAGRVQTGFFVVACHGLFVVCAHGFLVVTSGSFGVVLTGIGAGLVVHVLFVVGRVGFGVGLAQGFAGVGIGRLVVCIFV